MPPMKKIFPYLSLISVHEPSMQCRIWLRLELTPKPISEVIEGFCDTDGTSWKGGGDDCAHSHNINLSPTWDSTLRPYHGRCLSRKKKRDLCPTCNFSRTVRKNALGAQLRCFDLALSNKPPLPPMHISCSQTQLDLT